MTNTIISVLNTIQTKPIENKNTTAQPNHFKEVMYEHNKEIQRIDKITSLKKYTGEKTTYDNKTPHLTNKTVPEEAPKTAPPIDTDAYLIAHTQIVRQLMITKALDPPDNWVNQSDVKKAYHLD